MKFSLTLYFLSLAVCGPVLRAESDKEKMAIDVTFADIDNDRLDYVAQNLNPAEVYPKSSVAELQGAAAELRALAENARARGQSDEARKLASYSIKLLTKALMGKGKGGRGIDRSMIWVQIGQLYEDFYADSSLAKTCYQRALKEDNGNVSATQALSSIQADEDKLKRLTR